MRKVILALLFSLVITPVFGKIVTMNGVQYQVWIDEESGEYRMKPVDSSPKDFGKPKGEKEKIQILNGRYGVYVKFGKINASLPKDIDLEKFSIDEKKYLFSETGVL